MQLKHLFVLELHQQVLQLQFVLGSWQKYRKRVKTAWFPAQFPVKNTCTEGINTLETGSFQGFSKKNA